MSVSEIPCNSTQVEHNFEQRDCVTQTDLYMDGVDDLDLSLGDEEDDDEGLGDHDELSSISHDAIQPDPLLVTSAAGEENSTSNHDPKRRLLMDTEQRIMMLSKKIHLDIDMTPRTVATNDIGVQAGCGRNSRQGKYSLTCHLPQNSYLNYVDYPCLERNPLPSEWPFVCHRAVCSIAPVYG